MYRLPTDIVGKKLENHVLTAGTQFLHQSKRAPVRVSDYTEREKYLNSTYILTLTVLHNWRIDQAPKSIPNSVNWTLLGKVDVPYAVGFASFS